MGLFFSRLVEIYQSWGMENSRILMVGLDNAGKTTVLCKIKLNESVTTIPTIGFNVETVQMQNGLSFTVWDIGGQEKLRPLWQHYFSGTQGLIFIVDSNDPSRIEEARSEMHSVLNDDRMRNVPVLLLANKQDLPNSRPVSEITDKMGLHRIPGHDWHAQGCCAVTGDGVLEGLFEFSKLVKKYKKTQSR